MKCDLHIHSVFSDGSDTIEQIISIAKKNGLDAIAITDHDTVSHMEENHIDKDIQVIKGVEISSVHRSSNIRAHILGYNIRKPEIIAELTQPLLETRNRISEKQAELLVEKGFRIDFDKLPRADNKYLYKQHIMYYLVATGQASEMFGEFFQKIFSQAGISETEYIDVTEAVKAIKEAGGQAVLAHPGQHDNVELIPELVRYGLDGVEINHYSNSPKDKEMIRNYADQYGLFLTGGSDYHGRYEAQPFEIGSFLSEESGARHILMRE